MADSMLRGIKIGRKEDTDLIARGGAKVRDITAAVYYDSSTGRRSRIQVGGYKVVMIHVGTNDLADGRSRAEISMDVKELIDVVRSQNHDAVIVVSGILYRPVDDNSSYGKVNATNLDIAKVCLRFHGVLFLRTHALVKCGSMLLTQLYDEGGLHLNRRGLDRVGNYFRGHLTKGSLCRDFVLADRPIPRVLR